MSDESGTATGIADGNATDTAEPDGGPSNGMGKPTDRQPRPDFVLNQVKVLLEGLTPPESSVTYDTPARANPDSIADSIDPPHPTWTWADQAARAAQSVTVNDIGKYGLQTDIAVLFKLVATAPSTAWQPVRDFTDATWTWVNEVARESEQVTEQDIGKVGLQTDINSYFKLSHVQPTVWRHVSGPGDTSAPFELSTGAADADSFHDFFKLQIAFEDIWVELVDDSIRTTAETLYAKWNALMDNKRDNSGADDRDDEFDPMPTGGIGGATQLKTFLNNLQITMGLSTDSSKQSQAAIAGASAAVGAAVRELLRVLGVAGADLREEYGIDTVNEAATFNAIYDNTFRAASAVNTAFSALATAIKDIGSETFPEVTELFEALSDMLKERYRFDVFAPASINYGLVLNYRQHWKPQSYQVGNLASTIPLAPQETRKYTTKTVVKKARNAKELDESLRSGKEDKTVTLRADAEIVDKATNKTNFTAGAKGSYGAGVYNIEASAAFGKDNAADSAQTKRAFREAILKSAEEYRAQHRLEVTTDETSEVESTGYQEIKNPNDELTVTYLFYELQRRYLVSESLYKATPVILVANDVPAPHEVDQAWLVRHDWILKRSILDDSFLPALEYLSSGRYTSDEVALITLELAVQHQKSVVDKLAQQVMLATQSLDAATLGVTAAEESNISDLRNKESAQFIKGFFDPLGISQAGNVDNGNSNRARIELATEMFNRAQAKVTELRSDMKTELTALQAAIDKFTTASTRHFGMLAEIGRLRLHVRDNIIHYMQAIWTYEPTDQRYFRLYNLDVPVFHHNTKVTAKEVKASNSHQNNLSNLLARMSAGDDIYEVTFEKPSLSDEPKKLHQVADIDNLIGFKGNYMIFPIVDFDNYMLWYLMQSYIAFDPAAGVVVSDPDPYADLTVADLEAAMQQVHSKDAASFTNHEDEFKAIMIHLLSNEEPRMVVVPSESLFIEALPGTHPLLEDFKLIHRAIDVKKAQAEVRRAELENLRLAARLAVGTFDDPDIEKKIVVEGQDVRALSMNVTD
jgi:hypothetical protein